MTKERLPNEERSIEIDVLLIHDKDVDAYTAIWMGKYMASAGKTPEHALENLVYVLCAEFAYVIHQGIEPFQGIPETPIEYKNMYFSEAIEDIIEGISIEPSVVDGQSVCPRSVRLAA